MSYGLNVEMHKQTEIGKRLDAIIRQVLPFLSAEHQTQVAMAVERAKQITMAELNAVMQQAAAGSGLPGMPPGMPPPGAPGGLPPSAAAAAAGIPGMPPTSLAGGLLSMAGIPPGSVAPPGFPAVSSAAGLSAALMAQQQQQQQAAAAAAAAHAAQNAAASQPRPPTREGRDEKPSLAAIGEAERLKNSSSASPHNNSGGNSNRDQHNNSRHRSPASRSPRSSTPNEESLAKRIKSEDSARKSGHVSLWKTFIFNVQLTLVKWEKKLAKRGGEKNL